MLKTSCIRHGKTPCTSVYVKVVVFLVWEIHVSSDIVAVQDDGLKACWMFREFPVWLAAVMPVNVFHMRWGIDVQCEQLQAACPWNMKRRRHHPQRFNEGYKLSVINPIKIDIPRVGDLQGKMDARQSIITWAALNLLVSTLLSAKHELRSASSPLHIYQMVLVKLILVLSSEDWGNLMDCYLEGNELVQREQTAGIA